MSSGKPVVACRGQGIEEIIQHGRNGWLVAPDDLQGLTQALCALLENTERRNQIGNSARETILHGFTLAHHARALSGLYRCLG